MSKCENCIHYDVCEMFGNIRYREEHSCRTFKDKSLFVELPCKVGDKVSVRALCECVFKLPVYEECRCECPYEDDCECEECSESNERIFDTKISAIFNNGNGWEIEFEHFAIQARFSDIGTSFFIGENAHEQAEQKLKELESGK